MDGEWRLLLSIRYPDAFNVRVLTQEMRKGSYLRRLPFTCATVLFPCGRIPVAEGKRARLSGVPAGRQKSVTGASCRWGTARLKAREPFPQCAPLQNGILRPS